MIPAPGPSATLSRRWSKHDRLARLPSAWPSGPRRGYARRCGRSHGRCRSSGSAPRASRPRGLVARIAATPDADHAAEPRSNPQPVPRSAGDGAVGAREAEGPMVGGQGEGAPTQPLPAPARPRSGRAAGSAQGRGRSDRIVLGVHQRHITMVDATTSTGSQERVGPPSRSPRSVSPRNPG